MRRTGVHGMETWRLVITVCSVGVAGCHSGVPHTAPDAPDGVDASPPTGIQLELIAGGIGGPGSLDGTGANARFSFPTAVAISASGTIYVADSRNHTIRAVTAAGEVTTFAGAANAPGRVDGPRRSARFSGPAGLALDSGGNLYVTELGNETIRKITPGGEVTTIAGGPGVGGSTDGARGSARFHGPAGIDRKRGA